MLLVVLPTGQPGPAFRDLVRPAVDGRHDPIDLVRHLSWPFLLGDGGGPQAGRSRALRPCPASALCRQRSLAMLGSVMSGWSIWSALLGVASVALQFRRMQHEENILRSTFPEYEEYGQNVPMIIPSPVAFQPTWQGAHSSR